MECSAIPAKVIASCFALVAFSAAVAMGWYAGNGTSTIILRALVVMGLCWLMGFGVGSIAQKVVDRHIEEYKKQHPIEGNGPAVATADGEHVTSPQPPGPPGPGATG